MTTQKIINRQDPKVKLLILNNQYIWSEKRAPIFVITTNEILAGQRVINHKRKRAHLISMYH